MHPFWSIRGGGKRKSYIYSKMLKTLAKQHAENSLEFSDTINNFFNYRHATDWSSTAVSKKRTSSKMANIFEKLCFST
jgi:hypothetical protein